MRDPGGSAPPMQGGAEKTNPAQRWHAGGVGNCEKRDAMEYHARSGPAMAKAQGSIIGRPGRFLAYAPTPAGGLVQVAGIFRTEKAAAAAIRKAMRRRG